MDLALMTISPFIVGAFPFILLVSPGYNGGNLACHHEGNMPMTKTWAEDSVLYVAFPFRFI